MNDLSSSPVPAAPADELQTASRIRGARQNNLKNLDARHPARTSWSSSPASRARASPRSSSTRSTPRASAATSRPSRPTRASSSTAWTSRRSTRIDGIPPAIAIDQTNPVRTSRSTVGTMTELNDHLKLLFARAGAALLPRLRRSRCGATRPESIFAELTRARAGGGRSAACRSPSRSTVPKNFTEAEVQQLLEAQGYTRIHSRARARGSRWCRTACAWASPRSARVVEALEAALRVGQGRVNVYRGEP